jgi:hypothetical protein
MNELVSLRCVSRIDFGDAVRNRYAFNRNDAIRLYRHDGAGHDLDALTVVQQRLHRITGLLRTLNRESPIASRQSPVVNCNAVHRDPIERRLIALRYDRLTKYATGRFGKCHVLGFKLRHGLRYRLACFLGA